jgi:hypothetical protein
MQCKESRKRMPNTAAPNTHANTIPLVAMELMVYSPKP